MKKTLLVFLSMFFLLGAISISVAESISIDMLEKNPQQLAHLKQYIQISNPKKLDALLTKKPLSVIDASTLMLTFLAQEKDPNLIKVVLKYGADPNMIVKKEDEEFTIFLLSMYQVTDASLIQSMIVAGADVNKDMRGNTIPFIPLMAAALMTTNPEIITVLLDAGATGTGNLKKRKVITRLCWDLT